MDRKAIIVVSLSVMLLLAWPFLSQRLQPQPPQQPKEVQQMPVDEEQASAAVAPKPAVPAEATTLVAGAPEETVELRNSHLELLFSSHGGGVKQIQLLGYPETVVCPTNAANPRASLNTRAPMPALALLAGEKLQGDGIYQIRKEGEDRVIAEKQLESGLLIVKEFRLGTNFLLEASVRLINSSEQPIVVPEQQWVVGTATPLGFRDEAHVMGVFWFDGAKAEHVRDAWFRNRLLSIGPGTPRSEYIEGRDNVVWTAVHNQFFTLIAIPAVPAPQVSIRKVELPPPPKEIIEGRSKVVVRPSGFQTALVYPASILPGGESIIREYTVYAGPKEFKTLENLGREMNNELERVMDFGGFFGFFSQFLLASMNGLRDIFGFGYGYAIICITVIIKLVFWPLTNASTRSMKRMSALQPQMKALQEKYKDDPKKMNQKLMEFMRENKVNPMGSCLPLLLQLPIFIGFYKMLQSAIELRGEHFLWVCDLSQADTIFIIPGLNFPFNPLPMIMGVTMLFQARITPMAPGMDPVQQKILKYMPMIFIVILYNMSAGLVLYWTVQNALTILQMKITRASDAGKAAPGQPGKPSGPPPARPQGPPKKKKP